MRQARNGAFKIERTLLAANTTLAQTMVLESFESAVNIAISQGVQYGQIVQSGNWQLIFGPPLQPGFLPAIIHALFR